jgi:hypothetical protein
MTIPSQPANFPKDILIGIASNLAYDLIKYGAKKINEGITGTPQEKFVNDVCKSGFLHLLEKVTNGIDKDDITNLETIFTEFLSDSIVAETMLETSLTGWPPNIELLKEKFSGLGFDTHSLPFDFEEGIMAFCIGCSKKAIELGSEPGNEYGNPIILGRLRTVLGLLLRVHARIEEVILELNRLEETRGITIYIDVLGSQTVRIRNLNKGSTQLVSNEIEDLEYSEQTTKLLSKLPNEIHQLFGVEQKVDQLLEDIRDNRKYIYSLQGTGGIGKTSLAVYTMKKAILDEFQFLELIWVNAKQEYINERGVYSVHSRMNLLDVINELGRKLKIPRFKQFPQGKKIDTLVEEFKTKPYFVVIDNLETVESIQYLKEQQTHQNS